MLAIDSHAHISALDKGRYPAAPVGGDKHDPALDAPPFPAERLIDAMAADGVGHALVVQRAHIYGYDNSYVCDAAARFPERLSAVVAVDASDPGGPDAVRHWVGERMAKGLRLVFPGRPGPGQEREMGWLSGQQALDVWKQADLAGVPVCVHLMRSNREAGIAAVAEIAVNFPDVPIVLDHLGNIAADQSPPSRALDELSAVDLPNVIFKVVPLNFKAVRLGGFEPRDLVRAAADRFGAGRLMYGSDVTNSPGPYGELMAAGREAASLLNAAEQADFLGRTAAGAYRLGASAE